MPRAAEARAWWADVEDVRERIERRRAREQRTRENDPAGRDGRAVAHPDPTGRSAAAVAHPAHRGVREVQPGRHLMLVRTGVAGTGAPAARDARRRSRPRAVQRIGPRPDRVAAWAVGLGFLLVLVAVLSAHG